METIDSIRLHGIPDSLRATRPGARASWRPLFARIRLAPAQNEEEEERRRSSA